MIFEKVSFYQYCKDCKYDLSLWKEIQTEDIIYTKKQMLDMEKKHEKYLEWSKIPMPRRATEFSAGYDFTIPIDIWLEPNATITIPTGIVWNCKDEMSRWRSMGAIFVLKIMPRSGLGFKYQLGLKNTEAVIDMDYCISENEGHIMIGLVNRGDSLCGLEAGDRFVQGIIENVWITSGDNPKLEFRNGGFGSTDEEPKQK